MELEASAFNNAGAFHKVCFLAFRLMLETGRKKLPCLTLTPSSPSEQMTDGRVQLPLGNAFQHSFRPQVLTLASITSWLLYNPSPDAFTTLGKVTQAPFFCQNASLQEIPSGPEKIFDSSGHVWPSDHATWVKDWGLWDKDSSACSSTSLVLVHRGTLVLHTLDQGDFQALPGKALPICISVPCLWESQAHSSLKQTKPLTHWNNFPHFGDIHLTILSIFSSTVPSYCQHNEATTSLTRNRNNG